MEELKRKLRSRNIDIEIRENVPMSRYTSFKAGGCAAAFAEVHSSRNLAVLLETAVQLEIPHMILGNGSNTLFRDSGYEGLVIRPGTGMDYVNISPSEDKGETFQVRCGVSVLLSVLARSILAESLTGFEFASGIPGSLGGALFMNAGAYGGEMKQVVKWVRAISPDGKEEKIFTNEEMKFGYRHSVLEDNGYIAVEAMLELRKGDRDEIAAQMKELAARRNSKQPVNFPSAGSTFKRPPGYFAGKLIEDAGLKGVSVGGAQVSVLHSGFIINKDNATAEDILQLITLVQNTVYDKFGVMLEPEVRIIG